MKKRSPSKALGAFLADWEAQHGPLTPEELARARAELKLPIFRGKGELLPGIDPTSNRSMLDAADAEEPPLSKPSRKAPSVKPSRASARPTRGQRGGGRPVPSR
jgi:hypothetical protein